jgi:UDP-glucuronate decarboxylase
MAKKEADEIVREDIRRYAKCKDINWGKLSGKTILIAGASGFLPSYAADTVAVLNDEVLSEPCRAIAAVHSMPSPDGRIGHLLSRKDFTFVTADLSKGLAIPKGVDYFIHGASPASPRQYLSKPIETMDANVNGLRAMLDYSRSNRVESILFISSGAVNAENAPPENIPTKEDFPGISPFISERSCYSEAKRYCETMCYQFCKAYGAPANAARPFHTYGPGLRLDDGRAIADFMSDAISGNPINVRSSGNTLMTYCYVADVAEAFFRILLSDAKGEAFNVASPGPEFTVLELAKHVSNLFDPPAKISVSPEAERNYQKGSSRRTIADTSKMKRMLGWSPQTGMDGGLKRMLDWHLLQKR